MTNRRAKRASPALPAILRRACIAIAVAAGSASAQDHLVPLFPAASDTVRQGFVRVINHGEESGEVSIEATDDDGNVHQMALSIDAGETVHFNSNDLEDVNVAKGVSGTIASGNGDWHLNLASDLDIEVLAYIRTQDGFLTAMHDLVPESDEGYRVATFNPGRNANQVSHLRLINPGATRGDGDGPRHRRRRRALSRGGDAGRADHRAAPRRADVFGNGT